MGAGIGKVVEKERLVGFIDLVFGFADKKVHRISNLRKLKEINLLWQSFGK